MENNAILEQIKANGMKNFKAVNIGDSTTYRCYIENDGNIFVYARNKKRYGWRFDEEQFLIRFTPLITISPMIHFCKFALIPLMFTIQTRKKGALANALFLRVFSLFRAVLGIFRSKNPFSST